jgi:hypothetical protein
MLLFIVRNNADLVSFVDLWSSSDHCPDSPRVLHEVLLLALIGSQSP